MSLRLSPPQGGTVRFTQIHSDTEKTDVEREVEAVIGRLRRADKREAELMALLEQIIAANPDLPRYECVLDYDAVLRWHCRLDGEKD